MYRYKNRVVQVVASRIQAVPRTIATLRPARASAYPAHHYAALGAAAAEHHRVYPLAVRRRIAGRYTQQSLASVAKNQGNLAPRTVAATAAARDAHGSTRTATRVGAETPARGRS